MHTVHINKLPNSFKIENFISELFLNNSLNIEIIYESNFKNAKILRDFIENICIKSNFDKINTSKFILIVDELNNNAIEYGTKKGGINKLRIKVEKKDNIISINIEVEDEGTGKRAKKALEMETLRAHQLKLGYGKHASIRGRGLFMITVKVVDRLYFKDTKSGGLIVGIKKKIEI